MAPRPVVASGVQLEVRYTWNGQEMENVFGYRHTAPVSGAQLNAMCNSWWVVNGPSYRALFSSDVTFREVHAKDRRSSTVVTEGTYSLPPNTTGTHPGSVGNPASAARFQLRTGYAGRSYRGAKSIGPIPSISLTQGTFDTPYATLVSSFMSQVLVPILSDFFLAVLSEKLGSSFDVIAIALLNNFIDSQKTRLLAHGR